MREVKAVQTQVCWRKSPFPLQPLSIPPPVYSQPLTFPNAQWRMKKSGECIVFSPCAVKLFKRWLAPHKGLGPPQNQTLDLLLEIRHAYFALLREGTLQRTECKLSCKRCMENSTAARATSCFFSPTIIFDS